MTHESTRSISTQNLSIELIGNKILDNISIEIPANKLTIIVGPNGAGKSFLLRSLAGLEDSVRGQVYLNNKSLLTYPKSALASFLSWVPERLSLPFNYRTKDICLMGRFPIHKGRPGTEDNDECYRVFDLLGISNLLERKTDELSSGEIKKVVVATSLASGCGTLLLDEPTANLDVSSKINFLNVLKNQSTHKTTVAVLHDLPLAHKFADHIILLADAKVHSEGPPEVALSYENIKEVFGVQSEVVDLSSGESQLAIF
jgi:iron complex transport system ATP-binding protein